MLILPPGHAQNVAPARRLSGRERRLVGGVLVVVVALALALLISLASSGGSSAHGCIRATIPGDVGAQEIDQCGAAARSTCGSALQPEAFTTEAAHTIAVECRKAGLPVGR